MICKFALVALLVVVVASVFCINASPSSPFYRELSDFHFTSGDHFKAYHMEQEGKNIEGGFWPSTVDPLNATAYLGRWYQVAGNWFVLDTFSNNTVCPTATYTLNSTSPVLKVNVWNWERQYSVTGPVKQIYGYATQPNATTYPGRLSVTLDGAGVDAPYWIYNTSAIENGEYQWAIVSDYFKLTLFILVRDVEAWETKYETEVLELAAKRGFTGHNSPIKIVQSPQCNYNNL